MVRCDRCDQIFHLSCLKPALRDVPEETWFCKNCEPDTVLESPLKKQRTNGTAASAEPEAAPPAEKPVSYNHSTAHITMSAISCSNKNMGFDIFYNKGIIMSAIIW